MPRAELLTAAVFVGMLIGGLIAGSAADRFGRRYCLLVSLTVNLSFGALSAAAPSIGWLIMARVCAGLGKPPQIRALQEQYSRQELLHSSTAGFMELKNYPALRYLTSVAVFEPSELKLFSVFWFTGRWHVYSELTDLDILRVFLALAGVAWTDALTVYF